MNRTREIRRTVMTAYNLEVSVVIFIIIFCWKFVYFTGVFVIWRCVSLGKSLNRFGRAVGSVMIWKHQGLIYLILYVGYVSCDLVNFVSECMFRRPCFTPFCINAPYQFTPLLNLRPLIFGLTPVWYTPHFLGTQLGRKARPWREFRVYSIHKLNRKSLKLSYHHHHHHHHHHHGARVA